MGWLALEFTALYLGEGEITTTVMHLQVCIKPLKVVQGHWLLHKSKSYKIQKSYRILDMGFRFVQNPTTLNDLDRSNAYASTSNQKV